jgi:hypothetical protein
MFTDEDFPLGDELFTEVIQPSPTPTEAEEVVDLKSFVFRTIPELELDSVFQVLPEVGEDALIDRL